MILNIIADIIHDIINEHYLRMATKCSDLKRSQTVMGIPVGIPMDTVHAMGMWPIMNPTYITNIQFLLHHPVEFVYKLQYS